MLKSFSEANNYFVRTAEWRWIDNDNIAVIDPKAPRILTFDPWPQEIFLAADGTKTVKEYIYFMADKYKGLIPAELDETIITQLSKLKDIGIIKISNQKEAPQSAFDKPRS